MAEQHPPDNTDPAEPGSTQLRATASGDARIYQAARDQLITDITNNYFGDGVVRSAPVGSDECPYPGLAAYEVNQGEEFFGRDDVVTDLLALADRCGRAGGPMVLVGSSGSGKSSVLRAGLLYAIEQGRLDGSRNSPAPMVIRPGADPVGSLNRALGALRVTVAARLGLPVNELTTAGPDPVVAVRSWLTQLRAVSWTRHPDHPPGRSIRGTLRG